MQTFEQWFEQDLSAPVITRHCEGLVFSADNLSNTIGVKVYQDTQPVTVTGSVACTVIRQDGGTVTISGTSSGNAVSATLTGACFAVPGPIAIMLQIVDGTTKVTVLRLICTAVLSATDQAIDPGTIIPSVTDLIAEIDTAIASIPADYSELLAAIAPTFSASTAYAAGAYVWYDGDLYRFTADHAVGSWTGSDAAQVALAGEVTDLKSAINDISAETRNLNTKGCGRYTANGTTGVISQNASSTTIAGMSDKIPCEPNKTYTVTFYDVTMTGATIYSYFYDATGAYLERSSTNNISNNKRTFTTLANAYYVYCCAYVNPITFGENPRIQIEEGTTSTDYIVPFTADDAYARSGVQAITDGLTNEIELSLYAGYYNANGVIAAPGDQLEKYTQRISGHQYASVKWNLSYEESVEAWCAISVWKTDGTYARTVLVNTTGSSFSGEVVIDDDVSTFAFSFRSYGENALSLIGVSSVSALAEISGKSETIDGNRILSSIGVNINRLKPFYDHLFIDTINGNNVIIPSESLFNIQISKRLGFDMIEANVQETSDGKYIIMHGVSGKFGAQVEHIDGTTDISDTAINTVTLAWIKQNVRYKSLYAKYRVAPPSLEEFLYECRKNCMIPLVTMKSSGARAIVNSIMGNGNYVAYQGTRETTQGPIMTYPSLTTKADILNLCRSFGVPYMYCMANPTAFTDAELTEIVGALHAEGYWIGYAGSYLQEPVSQRLLALGFDFCASNYQINEFESGNLCNLNADIDYGDFITTGTVTNSLLTLQNEETLEPNANLPTVFLGGGSLHIRFVGTITISMGKYINTSITSDGTQSMWFSTYYLNRIPTFLITATAETQIINVDFKASKM